MNINKKLLRDINNMLDDDERSVEEAAFMVGYFNEEP